jgi:hypothetical protein
MKLKSKDKKKAVADAHNKKQLGKIARFDNGGNGQNWNNLSPTDQNAGIGGQFSAPSVNNTQMPSYQSSQNSSVTPDTSQSWSNANTPKARGSRMSTGQVAGYAAQAVQGLSPLWTESKNYTPPVQSTTNTIGNTVKGIASNIPIAGAFVQAGSMLGEGFQTGTNLAYSKIDEGKGNKATNQHGANAMSFFKGMTDPISNYTSIADAKKKGLISTGDAVGMGLSHLIGGSGISEAILQKKFHQYNVKQKQKDAIAKNDLSQTPFDQQTDSSLLGNLNNNPVTAQNGLRGMSKYANGGDGQLEQYNTGLHKNMPESFANAQLDGKPIQLQRKESIFRKKNGGDYVFTDNLMNPETGNLISEDASKIDKKVQKPFYDEASLKTKNFKMEKLANLNDKIRGSVEQKSEFPMYAKNGGSVNKYFGGGDGSNPLWTSLNEGSKNYRTPSEEEQFNNSIKRATGNVGDAAFNPNAYTNLQVDEKLNNTVFAPGKLGPTRSHPSIGYGKDKQGNNLTTGDYIQMAGSAVAPIANIANFARKAEKVKAHLDNTQYSDPRIAKDFNPLYLAENAAAQDIDKGSLSDSVRRAARVSLASGTQRNLQDYSLAVDNQNKGLEMQRDNMLAGTNRFNANQLTNRDTAQSQTNAVRRNYLNTGLAQAGQSMVDFGKMKNQGKTNEIEYSTLQNLASNYGLDPKEYEDFLKSKGVKIKYK